MKATVMADHQGRTLWTDGPRPGRMHDAAAARTKGIAVCFHHFPTEPGVQGTSLLMLMVKSRHKKPENVRCHFKPSPEAISELTSLLAPGGSSR
ncbi:hypothetical protein GCM10027160_54650 [Streptomyces calidiresistens]